MNASMLVSTFFAALMTSGAGVAQTAAASPAATAIKPGLWETTIASEDPVANSKHSVVGRTCVESAEVANLARIVPAQRELAMQCENRDLKREGSTVVWTISCKSSDTTVAGKGKMSFFGDSYLGTAEVERRKQGGKAVKLTQSFSGKWLQACS